MPNSFHRCWYIESIKIDANLFKIIQYIRNTIPAYFLLTNAKIWYSEKLIAHISYAITYSTSFAREFGYLLISI